MFYTCKVVFIFALSVSYATSFCEESTTSTGNQKCPPDINATCSTNSNCVYDTDNDIHFCCPTSGNKCLTDPRSKKIMTCGGLEEIQCPSVNEIRCMYHQVEQQYSCCKPDNQSREYCPDGTVATIKSGEENIPIECTLGKIRITCPAKKNAHSKCQPSSNKENYYCCYPFWPMNENNERVCVEPESIQVGHAEDAEWAASLDDCIESCEETSGCVAGSYFEFESYFNSQDVDEHEDEESMFNCILHHEINENLIVEEEDGKFFYFDTECNEHEKSGSAEVRTDEESESITSDLQSLSRDYCPKGSTISVQIVNSSVKITCHANFQCQKDSFCHIGKRRPHMCCMNEENDSGGFSFSISVNYGIGIIVIGVVIIVLICVIKNRIKKRERIHSIKWLQRFHKRSSFELRSAARNAERYHGRESECENEENKSIEDAWQVSAEKIDIFWDEKLGSGAFGTVYKGMLNQEAPICKVYKSLPKVLTIKLANTTVAVKVLSNEVSLYGKGRFLEEIDCMKPIGYCSYLVNLLGYCISDGKHQLIMEYCSNGDLLKYLRMLEAANSENDGEHLLNELTSFAWQISSGMEFLSSKGYIHRDLAARNVLVDDKKQAKIGDFGLCRIADQDMYVTHGGRLPLKWMAIESLRDCLSTTKSDVWSYGVLLYELFSLGKQPYKDIDPTLLIQYLDSGKRLDQPELCPEEIYNLMKKCWLEDQELRPSFARIRDCIADFMQENLSHDNYYLDTVCYENEGYEVYV